MLPDLLLDFFEPLVGSYSNFTEEACTGDDFQQFVALMIFCTEKFIKFTLTEYNTLGELFFGESDYLNNGCLGF